MDQNLARILSPVAADEPRWPHPALDGELLEMIRKYGRTRWVDLGAGVLLPGFNVHHAQRATPGYIGRLKAVFANRTGPMLNFQTGAASAPQVVSRSLTQSNATCGKYRAICESVLNLTFQGRTR